MTVAEPDPVMENEEGFKVPYHVALTTYLSYAILFIIGNIRDFYRTVLRSGKKIQQVCFVLIRVTPLDELCPCLTKSYLRGTDDEMEDVYGGNVHIVGVVICVLLERWEWVFFQQSCFSGWHDPIRVIMVSIQADTSLCWVSPCRHCKALCDARRAEICFFVSDEVICVHCIRVMRPSARISRISTRVGFTTAFRTASTDQLPVHLPIGSMLWSVCPMMATKLCSTSLFRVAVLRGFVLGSVTAPLFLRSCVGPYLGLRLWWISSS